MSITSKRLVHLFTVRGSTLDELANTIKGTVQQGPTNTYEVLGTPFREGRWFTGLWVQQLAFYQDDAAGSRPGFDPTQPIEDPTQPAQPGKPPPGEPPPGPVQPE